LRRRLAFIAGVAGDVRASVRRVRARGQPGAVAGPRSVEQASADELKRRLEETRARLRSEIPPRQD
jgi:hypothetical protein